MALDLDQPAPTIPAQPASRSSRRCSICNHPNRQAINRLLVDQTTSIAAIAKRFSAPYYALCRHAKAHVNKQAIAAAARRQAAQSLGFSSVFAEDVRSLLERAQGIGERLEALAAQADSAANVADLRGALALMSRHVGEQRECLALLGRATGELGDGGSRTLVLQLGAPLADARAALEVAREAETVGEHEAARRALALCRDYAERWPEEWRRTCAAAGVALLASGLREAGGDDPPPGGGEGVT